MESCSLNQAAWPSGHITGWGTFWGPSCAAAVATLPGRKLSKKNKTVPAPPLPICTSQNPLMGKGDFRLLSKKGPWKETTDCKRPSLLSSLPSLLFLGGYKDSVRPHTETSSPVEGLGYRQQGLVGGFCPFSFFFFKEESKEVGWGEMGWGFARSFLF